jgi:hypothetical protein
VLGPGRPAMRADTRENPVGKNGVMTIARPNLGHLFIIKTNNLGLANKRKH